MLRNCLSWPQGEWGKLWHNEKLETLLLLCTSALVSWLCSWRWCPVNYCMSCPFTALNDAFYYGIRNDEIWRMPFDTSRPWRRLVVETPWDSCFWWNYCFLQSVKMFLSLIEEHEQCFFLFFLGQHSDRDITITACLEGSQEGKHKFCLYSTYIQLGVKLCTFTNEAAITTSRLRSKTCWSKIRVLSRKKHSSKSKSKSTYFQNLSVWSRIIVKGRSWGLL